MFIIESKTDTLKTFSVYEAEEFLLENSKIKSCEYNNKSYSLIDFIWAIYKIKGDFKTHLELHRKFFGDFTLKKYINGKKSQKF